MLSKKSYITLLFIGALCLYNCTSTPKESTSITSPFENVDVVAQKVSLKAEEGTTFTYKTGSVVHIPARILVDANGNTVNGDVDIEYREFHTAADIIASGIPMTYDSAGTIHNFQTGGMFEIRAYAKKAVKAQMIPTEEGAREQLYVREGETIEVNLASFIDEPGYNFYALDNNTRQWDYEGVPSNGKPNKAKLARLDKLAPVPVEPLEPQSAEDKKFIFDLIMDVEEYPELAYFNGIMWEYIGDENDFNPTLEDNRWVFQHDWQDIKLSPIKGEKGEYTMQLSNKDKKIDFDVAPVLAGNNYKTALKEFEKKRKKFDKAQKKRIVEEKRMATEANMLRSLRINGFGIYNIDRIHYIKNPVVCRASFELDQNIFQMENTSVFLVTGDQRAVIRFDAKNQEKFYFDPKAENRIVAVLPDNKMAVFGSSDFESLDHEQINNKEHVFTLKVKDEVKDITSLKDMLKQS
ncbi:hypothetical protein R9C00_06645 [Flammeovirgaceae bacterium SG7u.111]|nr:hypothetical protein [Flammeovirgaceae bacterium SG7u.132]WPO37120.1 hypothetical protein R9C00_06645 [Flammeovirgaceae bacterium SG7u.111]